LLYLILFYIHNATPKISTLSLHDALPISVKVLIDAGADVKKAAVDGSDPLIVAIQNGHADIALVLLDHGADPNHANLKGWTPLRSEEHTSELQSRFDLVCRLLLEKKNQK